MIWHIALPEDWEQALITGAYTVSTRGVGIAEQGFLHASGTSAQVATIQGLVYADRPDTVLLAMDESALAAHDLTVRWEPGDPDNPGSEHFPHVYGGSIPVGLMTPVPALD